MLFAHRATLLALLLSIRLEVVWAQDERLLEEFKTEPTFRVPKLNITYKHPETSLLAPGHYFYAPFALDNGGKGGPIIFDSDGGLVWYGREASQHAVKSFRVCDYKGERGNHLCWSDFSFNTLGSERARNRIFDSTYTAVEREFGPIGDLEDPNPHEFNVLQDGKIFTQAVYQPRRRNLEAYMGPKDGYVIDPCFQEVDIASGKAVFRWCGLDHLKLHETILFPHVPGRVNYSELIAGDGKPTSPWDFAHINGIDKIVSGPSKGDYLVSTRHHDTIYKVAGHDTLSGKSPGSILWRFGGEGALQKDFKMVGNWTFSRQHHISFLGYGGQDGRKLRVSLFSNGWEIRNEEGFRGRASSGQIILLDEDSMEAELEHEYVHPTRALSIAQGGMHVTPQGNAIIGWGTVPEISEFAENGTLLFHARFAGEKGENYRAYKFPWQGNPTSSPKLVAYSLHCGNQATQEETGQQTPLMAYVSWNGATEVTHYRFYVSNSLRGPYTSAGKFARTGFETTANLSSAFGRFAPYVSVQALDDAGNVLGSTQTTTFVPRKDMANYGTDCDELGCNIPYFAYRTEHSCAANCAVDGSSIGSRYPGHATLVVLVIVLEILAYLGMKLRRRYAMQRASWLLSAKELKNEWEEYVKPSATLSTSGTLV